MEVHIHSEKKLSEIQEEFRALFPFLKIEFFKLPHAQGASSAYSHKLDAELTVREAGKIPDLDKEMKITSHTRVGKFEKDFQDQFGFGLQVFRKAGRAWILTTQTDDWTLGHQNEEGKQDSEKA